MKALVQTICVLSAWVQRHPACHHEIETEEAASDSTCCVVHEGLLCGRPASLRLKWTHTSVQVQTVSYAEQQGLTDFGKLLELFLRPMHWKCAENNLLFVDPQSDQLLHSNRCVLQSQCLQDINTLVLSQNNNDQHVLSSTMCISLWKFVCSHPQSNSDGNCVMCFPSNVARFFAFVATLSASLAKEAHNSISLTATWQLMCVGSHSRQFHAVAWFKDDFATMPSFDDHWHQSKIWRNTVREMWKRKKSAWLVWFALSNQK